MSQYFIISYDLFKKTAGRNVHTFQQITRRVTRHAVAHI